MNPMIDSGIVTATALLAAKQFNEGSDARIFDSRGLFPPCAS
jgi:hypothetical protein